MRLAIFATLSLAAVSLADKSALVVKDIAAISSAITTLNNTLNTFKPNDILGLFTALQIQNESTDLENAISKTTSDANASKRFTDGGSEKVAIAVLNLQPSIASVLNNIVVHKPAFATAILGFGDLSKTVESDLQSQRSLTAALGTAITKKLRQPYKSLAPDTTNQILAYFDKAIKAYNACTGLVCLPPINF